jgi:hypothetical protein
VCRFRDSSFVLVSNIRLADPNSECIMRAKRQACREEWHVYHILYVLVLATLTSFWAQMSLRRNEMAVSFHHELKSVAGETY